MSEYINHNRTSIDEGANMEFRRREAKKELWATRRSIVKIVNLKNSTFFDKERLPLDIAVAAWTFSPHPEDYPALSQSSNLNKGDGEIVFYVYMTTEGRFFRENSVGDFFEITEEEKNLMRSNGVTIFD